MSELKLSVDKISMIAGIKPSRTAISMGGGSDEPMELMLQIFPDECETNLFQNLSEKRGERLFVTIEPYDPSKHKTF